MSALTVPIACPAGMPPRVAVAPSRLVASPPLWVTLLACSAVLLWRRWDVVRSPQFWAEDSVIFFEQAHTTGWAALLHPYAGYLHIIPRLVAGVGALFDPVLAPALFCLAAFGFTLYVAALTQSRRCPFPRHVGFALAVVLVPDAFEVLLFLVNVQWVLAAALVLLLVSADPQRLREYLHDATAAILLGLTGPFSALLAGLFVWRMWRRRTVASLVVGGLVVGTALVQTGLHVTTGSAPPGADGPISILAMLGLPSRISSSLLAAGALTAKSMGMAAPVVAIATMAGVAWLGFRRGPWRAERMAVALAVAALLVAAGYRCRPVLIELNQPGFGARYFFPPQLLALWLLLLAAHDPRRRIARASALVLMGVMAVNLPRLREPGLADLNWPVYAAKMRVGEEVTAPVNPDWTVTLPGRPGEPPPGGIVNFSSRVQVGPAQPATIGFIVQPGPPRRFLIRVLGPSLAALGIAQPLRCVNLQLLRDGKEDASVAQSLQGGDSPDVNAVTRALGAHPLAGGRGDLAGVVQLGSGSYVLVVGGGAADSGEVLVEVFEIPGVFRQ